jgi:hypothetical protein
MPSNLTSIQTRAIEAAYSDLEKLRVLASDPTMNGHRAELVEISDRLTAELEIIEDADNNFVRVPIGPIGAMLGSNQPQ